MSPFREPARVTPDPSREAADLLRYEAELRRSQRRRERVVHLVKIVGYSAISAVVVALFTWTLVATYRAANSCEARGGVYLWREGKCVRGVER